MEVALCGHATLAAAYALYESNRVPKSLAIEFHTMQSGILTCERQDSGLISLNFPATPPSLVVLDKSTSNDYRCLLEGLGIAAEDVIYIGKSIYDAFVEISPRAFSKLSKINYSKIAELDTQFASRGLIVTTLGGKHNKSGENSESYDFLSRCFFPNCGINEDPVTGSAHCALTPYWYEKLKRSLGDVVTAYQASPRGGVLSLRLLKGDRVELSGYCATTLKSKVLI